MPGVLSRLLPASLGTLLARLLSLLRRWPPFATLLDSASRRVNHALDWHAFSASNPTLGARLLDGFVRALRLALGAAGELLRFGLWVLDPFLFVRRLLRFSAGVCVLYVAHAVTTWVGERWRSASQWLRIERGVWGGNERCIRWRELERDLHTASTYEQWRRAAQELDQLEYERIQWKNAPQSADYEWRRLEKNLDCLRRLISAQQAAQQQQSATRCITPPTLPPNDVLSFSSPTPTRASSLVSSAPLLPLSSSASNAASNAASSSVTSSLPPAPSAAQSASTSTSTLPPPPSAAQSASLPIASPPADVPSQALMRHLRSRLGRNLARQLNSRLYFDASKDRFRSSFPDPSSSSSSTPPRKFPKGLTCRVGTKRLIEEYQDEVVRGLDAVLHDCTLTPQAKLAFFRETRHAFGRSALLLNGGSNLGLYHLGVIKALLEVDALPQIISGSSVGAIFAALVCSRTDAELSKIGSSDFLQLSFPSVEGSIRRKLRRFLHSGILMDMQALIHAVRAHIGDLTFEQAYQRYGRILNIVVQPIHIERRKRRSSGGGSGAADDEDSSSLEEEQHSSDPILLNYLTAPSVLIWSAACASCAVPHLYAPVELLAKTADGQIVAYQGAADGEIMRYGAGCIDGSALKLDYSIDRLKTLFNCNNFIISQLNLSLLPFIFGGQSFSTAGPLQRMLRYLAREIYQRVNNLLCLLGVNMTVLGLQRNSVMRALLYVHALTSQAIKGDITLVPPVSYKDYLRLLENPTSKRLKHCVDVARRYTWTRASLIQAHCRVEFALDRCVRTLRQEISSTSGATPSSSSVTYPSASSGPFAHPNRPYAPSSLAGGSSSASPQGSASTTAGAAFWSRKLNARALQPPRKSSLSEPPPPPIDLGLSIGRSSPVALRAQQPVAGVAPFSLGSPIPLPVSTVLPLSLHARMRTQSNVSSPSSASASATLPSPLPTHPGPGRLLISAGAFPPTLPPSSTQPSSVSHSRTLTPRAASSPPSPATPRSRFRSPSRSPSPSPLPGDSSSDEHEEESESEEEEEEDITPAPSPSPSPNMPPTRVPQVAVAVKQSPPASTAAVAAAAISSALAGPSVTDRPHIPPIVPPLAVRALSPGFAPNSVTDGSLLHSVPSGGANSGLSLAASGSPSASSLAPSPTTPAPDAPPERDSSFNRSVVDALGGPMGGMRFTMPVSRRGRAAPVAPQQQQPVKRPPNAATASSSTASSLTSSSESTSSGESSGSGSGSMLHTATTSGSDCSSTEI